jgi:hypothetical protein
MGNARKIVGVGLAIAIAVALVVYVLLPKAEPSASSALVNQPPGPTGAPRHGTTSGGTGGTPTSPTASHPPKHQGDGDDHSHDGCTAGDTSSHNSDHDDGAEGHQAGCHDSDGQDHHDEGSDHHSGDEGSAGQDSSKSESQGDD